MRNKVRSYIFDMVLNMSLSEMFIGVIAQRVSVNYDQIVNGGALFMNNDRAQKNCHHRSYVTGHFSILPKYLETN